MPTLSATSGKVGDTITISGPELDDIADGQLRRRRAERAPSSTRRRRSTSRSRRPRGPGASPSTTASSGLTPYTSDEIFTITPTITLVTPSSATAGSPVMIQGTGFSGLTLGEVQRHSRRPSAASRRPRSARTSRPTRPPGRSRSRPAGGTVQSDANFGVKPTVTSFLPTRGIVGVGGHDHRLRLQRGTRRSSSTAARRARVTVLSADLAAARPCPPAATSGKIRVTTADGTSLSAASFVPPAAHHQHLARAPTPARPVGTAVTITGTSFTGATAVRLQRRRRDASRVDSDTQITTTVPSDGHDRPRHRGHPRRHGRVRDARSRCSRRSRASARRAGRPARS